MEMRNSLETQCVRADLDQLEISFKYITSSFLLFKEWFNGC